MRRPGLISAAIAVALVGVLWIRLEIKIAQDQEQVRYLEAQVRQLEVQLADVAGLRDAIMEVLSRKQVIETLQTVPYAAQVLEDVARRRPAGVSLIALRNVGRRIRLTAYAGSERAASTYLESLARSPQFQEAKLAEIQAEGARVRFTLDLRLKDRTL